MSTPQNNYSFFYKINIDGPTKRVDKPTYQIIMRENKNNDDIMNEYESLKECYRDMFAFIHDMIQQKKQFQIWIEQLSWVENDKGEMDLEYSEFLEFLSSDVAAIE